VIRAVGLIAAMEMAMVSVENNSWEDPFETRTTDPYFQHRPDPFGDPFDWTQTPSDLPANTSRSKLMVSKISGKMLFLAGTFGVLLLAIALLVLKISNLSGEIQDQSKETSTPQISQSASQIPVENFPTSARELIADPGLVLGIGDLSVEQTAFVLTVRGGNFEGTNFLANADLAAVGNTICEGIASGMKQAGIVKNFQTEWNGKFGTSYESKSLAQFMFSTAKKQLCI
jgi:hypothetical protein